MNRNVESHFALNPTRIDLSRSTFDRSSSVKTSFNAGDIVPFFLEFYLTTLIVAARIKLLDRITRIGNNAITGIILGIEFRHQQSPFGNHHQNQQSTEKAK